MSSLAPGTKLGPHEIVAPLGAGGMGEVYKARDTRLDRIVAIKILPSHLSSDADLRQRFEREARAISSLNHPHICTLHDIGNENGVDFLVLEHIEGETLAERLKRGALPLEEALRYGAQIADALAKAHRAGVVHRDLKPGNIMLTADGAKLLDFGLAAWLPEGGSGESSALSSLPTAHKALTEKGAVLGTFQYMAPEQLEGKSVDARTDIFALGVVLYEMVTGGKAFEGASTASLIASILERELKPISPPMLDHVVRRCIAKNPDARWQSSLDVRAELEWLREGRAQEVQAADGTIGRTSREKLAWSVAGAAGLALLALGVMWPSTPPDRELVRFEITESEGLRFLRFFAAPVVHAVSPDGRHVVFAARSTEGERLWIRSVDSPTPRMLPGAEVPLFPFWSPDSRSVAYFTASGALKKVSIDGSPPQTVTEANGFAGRGGTWGEDGTILFASTPGAGLSGVSSAGGGAKLVTELDASRGETSHRWPSFLPGGHHFFYAVEGPDGGIYVGSLDGEPAKRLLGDYSKAVYAEPGYVLFIRDNSLMAQPFDLGRLELSGDAVPLTDEVAAGSPGAYGAFSVSRNGVLAHAAGSAGLELAWFDRDGTRRNIEQPGVYRSPALSPDGKRIAVERSGPNTQTPDLWIIDLERGTNSRLTFDPGLDRYPIWSPDGDEIVFASNRSGRDAIYRKKASGSGEEELLLQTGENLFPTDWSRDGRFILYASGTGGERDLWALPLDGDREPLPLLQTEFVEWRASFSPDGKWIAYNSDESGRQEVFVQSFPPTGAKWQISEGGGMMPRFGGDGSELFYVTPNGQIMAVAISGGEDLQAGTPESLFEIEGFAAPNLRFSASADGDRFVIPTVSAAAASAIHVVLNWAAPFAEAR